LETEGVTRGKNKNIVVTFRRDDEWVLEYLAAIVEGKRELGIRTSLSYEVVRLVKNTLHNELKGSKLDALIVKEKLDDIRSRLSSDVPKVAGKELGIGPDSTA
jgi:hypothetical protein